MKTKCAVNGVCGCDDLEADTVRGQYSLHLTVPSGWGLKPEAHFPLRATIVLSFSDLAE